MNENLNLIEILKNVPKGTKLWTPLAGEVEFLFVSKNPVDEYPINTLAGKTPLSFLPDGRYLPKEQGQCMLFPGKMQYDWSQFKVEKAKVKITLRPFDRVLTRETTTETWMCSIFSHYLDDRKRYRCTNYAWKMCIPYNKDDFFHENFTENREFENVSDWLLIKELNKRGFRGSLANPDRTDEMIMTANMRLNSEKHSDEEGDKTE